MLKRETLTRWTVFVARVGEPSAHSRDPLARASDTRGEIEHFTD
jgi:hypothetical protein